MLLGVQIDVVHRRRWSPRAAASDRTLATGRALVSLQGGSFDGPSPPPLDDRGFTLIVSACVLPPLNGDASVRIQNGDGSAPACLASNVISSSGMLDPRPRCHRCSGSIIRDLKPWDEFDLWIKMFPCLDADHQRSEPHSTALKTPSKVILRHCLLDHALLTIPLEPEPDEPARSSPR